jgi:hypothetical protein
MKITSFWQAFRTARFSAVGEIGQATITSAPACTIALICCCWTWASPRAD